MDTALASFRGRIVDPYSVVTASPNFEDQVFSAGGNVTRVIDHGTRVAAMAGAVAPGASILPIQVFGWSVLDGKLVSNDLMIVEGIARAIAYGADIINLSVGTDCSRFISDGKPLMGDLESTMAKMASIGRSGSDIYRRVLQECRKRNILVVCAAGNDGVEDASVEPLAASGLTIVVGAIDRNNVVAGFSNRGGLVDCFAPGVGCNLEGAGGTRFAVSGTSISAPFVAGVLALARSAKLEFGTDSAKAALRKTNFEGRLSILPRGATHVFDPAAFFAAMGAEIPSDATQGDAQRRFAERYGDFFIEPYDGEPSQLGKILGYYQSREYYFEKSEAEYRLAGSLAYRNRSLLMRRVLDKGNGDFIAALLLADTEIPADELDAFTERASRSDYIAIVVSAKNRRQSVPALNRRLQEKVADFNSNTLIALRHFDDPSSLPIVKAFLAARQKTKSFERDEAWACDALLGLSGAHPAAEVIDLIGNSWNRYRATDLLSSPRELGYGIEASIAMVECLIKLRDAQGLVEASRLLAELEALDPPTNSADAEAGDEFSRERRLGLESLQEIVNACLPTDAKFNYLAPPAARNKALKKMSAYFAGYKFS
jgi:hypothetical protein